MYARSYACFPNTASIKRTFGSAQTLRAEGPLVCHRAEPLREINEKGEFAESAVIDGYLTAVGSTSSTLWPSVKLAPLA